MATWVACIVETKNRADFWACFLLPGKRYDYDVSRRIAMDDASPATGAGDAVEPVAHREHSDPWIRAPPVYLEINWADRARNGESEDSGSQCPRFESRPKGDCESH